MKWFEKILKKFRIWILKKLKVNELIKQSEIRIYKEFDIKYQNLKEYTDIVIEHVRWLNKHFKVGACVNLNKYDKTTMAILYFNEEGKRTVKIFNLDHLNLKDINQILVRFGKDNVYIDAPMSIPKPKYKY